VESLLGGAEVSALETSVQVRRGRNFLSDHLIALKFYRSCRNLFSVE